MLQKLSIEIITVEHSLLIRQLPCIVKRWLQLRFDAESQSHGLRLGSCFQRKSQRHSDASHQRLLTRWSSSPTDLFIYLGLEFVNRHRPTVDVEWSQLNRIVVIIAELVQYPKLDVLDKMVLFVKQDVCSGIRQRGILSPTLFKIYAHILINRLRYSDLGCSVGSIYIGCRPIACIYNLHQLNFSRSF